MTMLTLSQTNGSKGSTASQNWMQASVKVFFSGINWEDNPPEVQQIRLANSQPGNVNPLVLDMNMRVGQFFAAVNWDDAVIAAVVTQEPSAVQSQPDDLTLDDFSGLF